MGRPHTRMPYLIVLFILFAGCDLHKETTISGQTMGTTYHVTVIGGLSFNTNTFKKKIENRLEEINSRLSTHRQDSEISCFNALKKAGTPFAISSDFSNVLAIATDLHRITEGAWDGTVYPLVELWGFGRPGKKRIPSEIKIAAALERIGFNQIERLGKHSIAKKKPGVSLDLASVAKGYAVDQIAALIQEYGINDFIVEIGGEIYAAGLKKDGTRWRIGINTPDTKSPPDHVYMIVTLHNRALATSGDYRNFLEIKGRRFSHIINPKTGYPAANRVASVSIIAETSALADGLATAVMVMGPKAGLSLINHLDHVDGLIVVLDENDHCIDYYSDDFGQYIANVRRNPSF